MTAPKRIQRKRTKGWRMPEGAVYVGRPGVYGNPFRVGVPFCGPTIRTLHRPAEAVGSFRAWVALDTLDPLCWDHDLIVAHVYLRAALDRGELRGRDLACWCPLDQPCHADVLLELANRADPCAMPGSTVRTVIDPYPTVGGSMCLRWIADRQLCMLRPGHTHRGKPSRCLPLPAIPARSAVDPRPESPRSAA